MVWRILAVLMLATSFALGQGAQEVLQKGAQLKLTESQEGQIRAILNKTVKEYNQLRSRERDNPDLSEKLSDLRQSAQDEALKLLTPQQLQIWDELASDGGSSANSQTSGNSQKQDGSLIIPTIEELKNPPRPGAFGPSTALANTVPHPVSGEGYLVLTDHTNPIALAALKKLADFRGGEVMVLKDIGTLHENRQSILMVEDAIRKVEPRYVAIAPRMESYRENMHLCLLKILSSLDDDRELDVFPGYLMASDPEELTELVERTINFQPLGPEEIKPVSIGAIEDSDARRYRSYQKAKVMQRMFAEEGTESPAIIITTRKSHTERDDFPKLPADEGNIAMMPTSERHTFEELSLPAELAVDESNLLFMYGHGTTSRICGTDIDAFSEIDFTDELVFCGSCMSASPYEADRVNLESKRDDKRFAFYAMDNGAVMFFGHMGLCGGFPKVFPYSELVLSGKSTGEAYQQLMNSIIDGRYIPPPYSDPASSKDHANGHLYVLWGDPALVPIAK